MRSVYKIGGMPVTIINAMGMTKDLMEELEQAFARRLGEKGQVRFNTSLV